MKQIWFDKVWFTWFALICTFAVLPNETILMDLVPFYRPFWHYQYVFCVQKNILKNQC